MVSSQYRGLLPVTGVHPLDEDFECFGTLRWTQIMYDYFVSIGIKPIIVEAVDFIYNTKATTDKLCGMLGLDPEGVKDSKFLATSPPEFETLVSLRDMVHHMLITRQPGTLFQRNIGQIIVSQLLSQVISCLQVELREGTKR